MFFFGKGGRRFVYFISSGGRVRDSYFIQVRATTISLAAMFSGDRRPPRLSALSRRRRYSVEKEDVTRERGGRGGLIRVARLRATAAATAASSPQQRPSARLRRRSTHPGSELASPSRGRAMVDPFGQPGGWGDWPAAVATATETTLCCAAFSPRCFIIQKVRPLR